MFTPPDELVRFEGDELVAFHKKFQIDGWARLLDEVVRAFNDNNSKLFHQLVKRMCKVKKQSCLAKIVDRRR